MSILKSTLAALGLAVLPGAGHAEVDEFALCKTWGYPKGTARTWNQDCNKVGSYTNPNEIFLHNTASASPAPRAWERGPELDLTLPYVSPIDPLASGTIEKYLQTHRVTSLYVVKDGKVLLERYQYGRKADHLMLSHSISKTVLALLYGHAIAEGRIKLTERVADVLPDFSKSAFASDTVEDLLRMASGAALFNSYTEAADNSATNPINLQRTGDLKEILLAKTQIRSRPGEAFGYNGMQTALLGLMLRERLRGRTLTSYLEEKIWHPMGAEGPAVWIKDNKGYEGVQGQFAAQVRDYAKLGALFVTGGKVENVQVIPAGWIEQMTAWRSDKPQPRGVGYGLHVWLASAGAGRGFFAGTNGQYVYFDPVAKLILVQTAVGRAADYEGSFHFFAIRTALVQALSR